MLTCWLRVTGSVRTAAIPPEGIASATDGSTSAPLARAAPSAAATISPETLALNPTSVAERASYQNGESSLNRRPCDRMVAAASSSTQ